MTLPNAQSRVRDWLFSQALPLWGTAGIDAEGRFYEKLDFDGRPVTGLPRRTRVQARQVYVFAEAASLGWAEGAALARRGLEVLIRDNQRDDGLWVRATDDAGAVLDPTPDLYDLAFVLFGLAAAHRVLNDERALPLALATLAATEDSLADPVHGGWQEALPPVLPRRQNPHMHLLEALLFWQATAPNPVWEDAARRILDLFATRFFDARFGVLGEYFAADWSVAPGALGEAAEPGHHMEWVWLLDQAHRLGLPGHADKADVLFHVALERGFDAEGHAVREIGREAGLLDSGRRLWCQTETLRALRLRGEVERADALLDGVFATYLATTTPGLWVDSYDAAGRSQDAAVPASTFYHLMTAFSALLTETA